MGASSPVSRVIPLPIGIRGVPGSTKALLTATPNCAFCGDEFKTIPENRLTFEHVVPRAAFANNPVEATLLRDTVQNGEVACFRCNSRKASIPLFDFIRGLHGKIVYANLFDVRRQGWRADYRLDAAITKEAQHFFQQLKQRIQYELPREMVDSNRIRWEKLPNKEIYDKLKWGMIAKLLLSSRLGFVQSLEQIIYPFWGEGQKPNNPVKIKNAMQRRINQFIHLWARVDAPFVLGESFEAMIRNEFGLFPHQQALLLRGIRSVRRQMKWPPTQKERLVQIA